jgi:hypothetical protein
VEKSKGRRGATFAVILPGSGGAIRANLDRSTPPGIPMAKPNYGYEKRQRELAKKQKKAEKERKKANPPSPEAPPEGEPAPGQQPQQ